MNHLGSILAVTFGVSEIALGIRKRASGSDSRLADRGSALLQGFGHRYRSYMERTKRLIPSIY